ncbi:MAG: DUF2891 family protein [Pseudomonadota bacterium]
MAARSAWIAVSAALVMTLSGCSKEVDAETTLAPAPQTRAASRDEMASAFAAQASMCFARHDSEHVVFHGCVDWHSAAHGAYALTAYQLHTGDTRYAAQLDAALTPEGLAAELALLQGQPDFEMPYGRAWFLRLTATWRALHPHDHRLDALAAEAAQSILAFYEKTPPDPHAPEYSNPSWALINVLSYARAGGDVAMAERVTRLVRANFLTPRCDLSEEARGFIAVCVTWAWLVSEALPRQEFATWYARWNPGLETLEPVRAFPTAHDYGRNFSRAWGLYPLARALRDNRLMTSYAAHVAAGFTPPEQWRGEYLVNGHWVAQFGMLAIEPLRD